MNTPEEKTVIVTAFLSALVEGVRQAASRGVEENALRSCFADSMSAGAFDMLVTELIEQHTFRREGAYLMYCGPSPL